MKKGILILLTIQMILLAGCTLPLIGRISGTAGSDAGQEMLTLTADTTPAGLGLDSADNRASDIDDTLAKGLTSSYSGIANNGIPIEMSANTPGSISLVPTAGAIGAASSGEAIGTASSGEAVGTASPEGTIQSMSTGGAVNRASDSNGTGDAAVMASSAYEGSIPTGTAVAAEEYGASPELTGQVGGQETVLQGSQISETGQVRDITKTGFPVTVYYQDGSGCLIPMTRWIERQQGIAKAAVGLVIDSPIAREEIAYYGVYPVLPANTGILGINLLDGIAVIDFDRHLLQYTDALSERNIVASVVYTLTEFSSIRGVRIRINGNDQDRLPYGTDISGILDRENTVINSGLKMQEGSKRKADLFALKKANEGFTYLVPISVRINDADEEPGMGEMTAELLIKQLITGNLGELAAESGAFSEIPEGVAILGCNEKNGTVSVDFDDNFVKYGGNEKEESILKQLAYTIRQIDGINKLEIMVEGRPVQLPEGTDVSSGLTIPITINDVMDR